MKKLLKSQKGSSFAYILVVVSILLILTSSLITMTVANYRLGLIKGGRNTAFYFADGAIDVALTQIEELSHRAEVYASEKIDEGKFKEENEQWAEFEKWLENNTLPEVDDTLEGNDASNDSSGDDDENKKVYLTAEEASALYSEAVKKEFDKQYLLFLLEADDVATDYTLLEKDEDDKIIGFEYADTLTFKNDSDRKLNGTYLTSLQTSKFKPSGGETFDEIKELMTEVTSSYDKAKNILRLTIKTSGAYNIYNKAVEVAVDMKPPEYHYVTVTDMVRKEMYTNDILENALTAKGDIILVDGEVETYGDIYALGTFNDAISADASGYSNSVNHLNKGGVVVGYDKTNNNFLNVTESTVNLNGKGSLTVNGNIKTASSVKTAYNGSSITVLEDKSASRGGYVYADSYVTPNQITDTSLKVDSSMFIMDDVYIAGKNTTLKIGEDDKADSVNNEDNTYIDDTLLTFLDGGEVAVAGDVRVSPDLSSSIRINKNSVTDDSTTSIDADYLYVPGVAYIDVYRKDDEGTHYFRTGEAFTTEKNFFFYQKEFEEQEERTESVMYTDGDIEFGLVEYVDAAGNITDSPSYKAEHFLNSVYEELQKPADIRDDNIVDSKDKNIMTIHSMKRDSIGDGLDSDRDKYGDNYTLGVFQANGRIYNPRGLKMDASDFITGFRNPSNIISDQRMNLLGFRDYRHGQLKTTTSVDGSDVEMLDQFIDFEKAKDYSTINANGLLVTVTEKDVYINTGKRSSSAVVYEGGNNIRGLVATKGNIYIKNDDTETPLTFNGTLIAGGDIIFYGEGKKIIDNIDEKIELENLTYTSGPIPLESRADVYKTVGTSSTLMDVFHTDTGRKLIVDMVDNKSGYTRSIFYNLSLSIVDKDYKDYYAGEYDNDKNQFDIPPHPTVGKVDITMSSTPKLDGITKEKELKGYDLVYWREIKPSN